MQIRKSFIFNDCKLAVKLSLLLITAFLPVSCRTKNNKQVLPPENQFAASATAININTASAQELEKLPRVGAKTASAIVEFRETHGSFRRAEQLLLIDGISDKQFREIRSLIKIE